MVLVGAVFAVAAYQMLFPGLTYLRLWWCCWGSIQPQHTLEFDMTTMDIQVSSISCLLNPSSEKNLYMAR